MKQSTSLLYLISLFTFYSCSNSTESEIATSYPNVIEAFTGKIDLNNLSNYANQTKPAYITKDNTAGNPITDKGATLGRVLFYDTNLSSNNTVS